MINVKIISKPKSSGSATGLTTGGNTTGTATAKDAAHALRADQADEAKHAELADLATEATHAASAYDLDADSPARSEFLSRLADDVAAGRITFEKGLVALFNSEFKKGATFGDYVQGNVGAAIDEAGRIEAESITARGYLKVFELIYNRINALEGTTSFGDVGTIDTIQEGDGVQRLYMRKRWDGDFTAFQPGDIVYGYVNDLESGKPSTFYKAWAWVKTVDRENNVLTVAAYPDSEVPAGANYPLAPSMVITRWGNIVEADALSAANEDYSAVIKKVGDKYVNVRQTTFYINCDDGNIVELMGVNSPIVSRANYGTILGKLPAGLLDSKTAELINSEQPYLYARGIVVQDLIRIDYEGKTIRSSNYRGTWSAETAASETDYYRCTTGAYDTVTHNGSLWQCAANGTTDEPSDASGSWVNMTGTKDAPSLNVWAIIPNTDIVTIRYAADGSTTTEPNAVTCEVLLTSTDEGIKTYNSSLDLKEKGATLYYSLDGLAWKEFIMGAAEPLELEDETDTIDAENESVFTVGGDDVAAGQIGDRLYFELRTDTAAVARAVIPIVKDGKNGKDGKEGREGLLAYPAGVFDSETTYLSTGDTSPVVMYEGRYYWLRRGCTYVASVMPDDRKNPATDAANGGSNACWRPFDMFSTIFADIVMAEFAKLGSAVFYGDWLISQQGTLADGSASSDYRLFKTGEFTPNYCVNFRTGEMKAGNGVFSGYLKTTFKEIAESDAELQNGTQPQFIANGNLYIIGNDLNLHVRSNTELVLPCDAKYIGARVIVCENQHVYSRSFDFVGVCAENDYRIGGINPADQTTYMDTGVDCVLFLDGVVEFIGVPKFSRQSDGTTTARTEWSLISGRAAYLEGVRKTT